MAALMLLKACFQAAQILRQRKPDVVLGMGGFVAGPGGLMAKCLGIPLIIHEQNRVPGTTNRLLAHIANQVLEAFPGSFKKSANARCTGNPLRKPFLNVPAKQAKPAGEPVRILIFGGSQGAKVLNEIVPEAMAELSGVEIRHQTGSVMREQVASRYKALGIKAEVSDFIADMVAAYHWADLDGETESGPRPASEPETRAMMRFLRKVKPDRIVSFHQPLNGVDTDTKDRRFAKRLARALRLPTKTFDCGGVCHGTMTGWYNHRFAGSAVLASGIAGILANDWQISGIYRWTSGRPYGISYSIPGIGKLIVNGAGNRDYTLVMGMILVYGVFTLLCNLLADLLYGWLDPRIRHE